MQRGILSNHVPIGHTTHVLVDSDTGVRRLNDLRRGDSKLRMLTETTGVETCGAHRKFIEYLTSTAADCHLITSFVVVYIE